MKPLVPIEDNGKFELEDYRLALYGACSHILDIYRYQNMQHDEHLTVLQLCSLYLIKAKVKPIE